MVINDILMRLARFLKSFTFYDSNMNEIEMYKFFLEDCKRENKHPVTSKFYDEIDGIDREIIDYDLKSYHKKRSNNSIRLGIKYNMSDSTIKQMRYKLKLKLYKAYMTHALGKG